VVRALDQRGVAVGGPELSAQPLMQALKQPGAVRASFSFYNTRGDADALVKAVAAVATGQ
jgi:cysteine desulfurase / selenocysteine lyase